MILVWSQLPYELSLTLQAHLFYAIFTGPLGSDPAPTDPKDYAFAGAISLINTSRDDMVSEPGYIQILKPFQVGSAHLSLYELS